MTKRTIWEVNHPLKLHNYKSYNPHYLYLSFWLYRLHRLLYSIEQEQKTNWNKTNLGSNLSHDLKQVI